MIDLGNQPAPERMSQAEGNAHLVQLASQLAYLEAWQEANPNVTDYRLTGLIASVREAVTYATAIAHDGRIPDYEEARAAAE